MMAVVVKAKARAKARDRQRRMPPWRSSHPRGAGVMTAARTWQLQPQRVRHLSATLQKTGGSLMRSATARCPQQRLPNHKDFAPQCALLWAKECRPKVHLHPRAPRIGTLQPRARLAGALRPRALPIGALHPRALLIGPLRPRGPLVGALHPKVRRAGARYPKELLNGALHPRAPPIGALGLTTGRSQRQTQMPGKQSQHLPGNLTRASRRASGHRMWASGNRRRVCILQEERPVGALLLGHRRFRRASGSPATSARAVVAALGRTIAWGRTVARARPAALGRMAALGRTAAMVRTAALGRLLGATRLDQGLDSKKTSKMAMPSVRLTPRPQISVLTALLHRTSRLLGDTSKVLNARRRRG
mmetsp:Transcript_57203/g.148931  ORF Transcript_57203/g.148931 Transcript_57203/m.148931 type:complete len:361 (-) Transcript_57203:781-1863(-)